MSIFGKATAKEKELRKLQKEELRYKGKRREAEAPLLQHLLEGKVPQGLENTLCTAFGKAFSVVFRHGDVILDKTYSKSKLESLVAQHLEDDSSEKNQIKGLKKVSRKANTANRRQVLFAGTEGIALGLLGIGIPDVPLISALLLRNVYTTAQRFGFSNETEAEKLFILILIETALLRGDDFFKADLRLNLWIDKAITPDTSLDEQIEHTAKALSAYLLYAKFLQGLPIIGALGGFSDGICMEAVSKYSKLKYKRRFLQQGS